MMALGTLAIAFVAAHAAVASGPSATGITPSFTIASTISDSPTTEEAALLFPGVARFLWYTVTNRMNVPITVTSLSISKVSSPAGCGIDNLDLTATSFTGSLVVAPKGENSVVVPLSLRDTPSNQDACEGVTFNFAYAGTATFQSVYATSTDLSVIVNPSSVDPGVTYVATVTASTASSQIPVPNAPTGTVSFFDGTDLLCQDVPLTAVDGVSATASCRTSLSNGDGSSGAVAFYTNSDDNFADSTSAPAPGEGS